MKKSNLILIYSLLISISLNAQWQQSNGVSGSNVISITDYHDRLYAGTTDGVLQSADGGLNWSATVMVSEVYTLTVYGENLYAANESNGLAFSDDDGESWTAANTGLTPGIIISAFSANETSLYAGTNSGLFISSDGANWSDITNSLTNTNITTVIATDMSLVVGTAGGGIFSTLNDGASWIAFNQGLTDLNVTCFGANMETGDMFAGTYSGIFHFSLDNPGWTLISEGLTNLEVNCILVNGSVIYAGTQNGGAFVSFDDGNSWLDYSEGLPQSNIKTLYADDTFLFVGTESEGIWMRPLSEFSQIEYNTFRNITTISPNPVNDELTIEKGENEENLQYKIINPIGQIILSGQTNGKAQINTAKLNQGLYFLIIEHNSMIETIKFLKN